MKEGSQALKEFNLGKNFIGDQSSELLGRAIAVNSVLLKFSLYHNDLKDKSAVQINKGLQTNRAIEEINLGKNMINLRYIHMIDQKCKSIKDQKNKADTNPDFQKKKVELKRVQGI